MLDLVPPGIPELGKPVNAEDQGTVPGDGNVEINRSILYVINSRRPPLGDDFAELLAAHASRRSLRSLLRV